MENGVLRLSEVRQAVGLSARTIRRLEAIGQFPARRRLSSNAIGWLKSEIEAWIASRGAADSLSTRDAS